MAFDGGAAQRSVDFLHLKFDVLGFDFALDRIAARASLDAPFGYVVTPNVDHVVGLAHEPARRALYDRAWLTLNDSRMLEALAKRVDIVLPAVPGADLARALFERVIERHEPTTIIGGDAGMIAALRERYGLTDIRWHAPPMQLKQNPRAIAEAAAFAAAQGARFTFICVGAPQQELVAYAISLQAGATGVGLCLGAALDFLGGRAVRAPLWMRRAGLEWLHRLASQPRRMWRRYLVKGPRIFAIFRAWRADHVAAFAH